MLYLNQAGTSWPKPDVVTKAITETLESEPGHWAGLYQKNHAIISGFFKAPEPDRLLYSSGCTAALAYALSDLDWQPSDRIITSSIEHHALAREITKLWLERGIEYVKVPYGNSAFDLDFYEAELKKGKVRLVAVSHASNVTGEILPIKAIIDLAHQYNALVLLDAAQTAGILPIDLADLDVDLFTFAGHKAPLGPQGIGALYVHPRVQMNVPSAKCEIGPNAAAACSTLLGYCDLGSVNNAALAGLAAGLSVLAEQNMQQLRENRLNIATYFLEKIKNLEKVKLFGSKDAKSRTSAFSIVVEGLSLREFDKKLKNENVIGGGWLSLCTLGP